MKREPLSAEKALQIVACQNSTTIEAVRNEIYFAVLEGICNPDPDVQAIWKAVPHTGEVPTPEELIDYLAEKLRREWPHPTQVCAVQMQI